MQLSDIPQSLIDKIGRDALHQAAKDIETLAKTQIRVTDPTTSAEYFTHIHIAQYLRSYADNINLMREEDTHDVSS